MYEFNYHRPTTVRQAANLLTKNAEAKLLAGGHSLIPVMKLRLAKPSDIVDLSQIEGLSGIELKGRSIVIGAMTQHAEVANSQIVQGCPSGAGRSRRLDRRSGGAPSRHHRRLARQQRSDRRLSGGLLGLGATIITNKRRIAADDFFKGMFETALEPDEIITKVQFPIAKKAAYEKFKHPASGFALVGVFVPSAAPTSASR